MKTLVIVNLLLYPLQAYSNPQTKFNTAFSRSSVTLYNYTILKHCNGLQQPSDLFKSAFFALP
jgi:hypothetical protein